MSKRNSSMPLLLLYTALGLCCVGLLSFGVVRMSQVQNEDALGLGCMLVGSIGTLIVCATAPVAWMLQGLLNRQSESAAKSSDQWLSQIHENTMLSDAAKRVLFRDRELDLLRKAIEADISRSDFHAGLTLCDEMANLFGHREEAEKFRERLLQAGHDSYESQVHQALGEFDRVLIERDWAKAYEESARIKRLYPESQLVHELDQRIMAAREEHKRELESQFLQAAERNEVDQAMRLLKTLDRYLTREEAGRLANVAQSVVVKHRDALSRQFKDAVGDHRWAEAAQMGDEIMAEYPNTKMADEVRSMIDVLRVRATQAAVTANV